MKSVIVTGKSVEAAVQKGLKELNTTEDRVKIDVLEHPSRGLFGLLGYKEAKVRLEIIPDPVEEAVRFLTDVFSSMGLDIVMEKTEDEHYITLNLSGPEIGLVIGRRGQTLDALQYLVNLVAGRYMKKHKRIILDAEQFRSKRQKTLEELSRRLAERVVRTKKEITLEPMTPHERKTIHSTLQNHPKVKTYSKGEEPNRRVVITLK